MNIIAQEAKKKQEVVKQAIKRGHAAAREDSDALRSFERLPDSTTLPLKYFS